MGSLPVGDEEDVQVEEAVPQERVEVEGEGELGVDTEKEANNKVKEGEQGGRGEQGEQLQSQEEKIM